MSSVRMSETIRKQIVYTGDQIFNASEARLFNKLASDIHDRAAAEYVAVEFTPHIKNFPTQWLVSAANVSYSIKYYLGPEPATEMEYSFSEESLMIPVRIAKILGFYSTTYGNTTLLTIPKSFVFSLELSSEISKWRQAIQDTHKEKVAFMDELKSILQRCNTLKQFLDTWPQGENLVSANILAKLNERPVREKKEPMLTEEASVALSTTLLKRTLMS